MDSPPAWTNLSWNYTEVQDSFYPILLPCPSPSQVSELYYGLKALLASLGILLLYFTGVSCSKSFACLISS